MYFSLPNVIKLNHWDNIRHRIDPAIPVTQVNLLVTLINVDVLSLSKSFLAEAISFTELMSKPSLVMPEIRFNVELNNPKIPKPVTPINNAAILDLAIDIKMVKIWTPPNNEVAFIICLYEFLSASKYYLKFETRSTIVLISFNSNAGCRGKLKISLCNLLVIGKFDLLNSLYAFCR